MFYRLGVPYLAETLAEWQLKELGKKGNVLHFTAKCIIPVDFTGEVVALDRLDYEWIFTVKCRGVNGTEKTITIGTGTYHLQIEVIKTM